MNRWFKNSAWCWVLSIAAFGVLAGCGVPASLDLDQQAAPLTAASAKKALQELQFPRQTRIVSSNLRQLLEPAGLDADVVRRQYASHHAAYQMTSSRYFSFRMEWKGHSYDVSTDLQSPSFQVLIKVPQLPLRLQCIPSEAQPRLTLPLKERSTASLYDKGSDDVVRFERAAKELMSVVWSPMFKVWKYGRCATNLQCDSTIFSDITLDRQGPLHRDCKLELLNKPVHRP